MAHTLITDYAGKFIQDRWQLPQLGRIAIQLRNNSAISLTFVGAIKVDIIISLLIMAL